MSRRRCRFEKSHVNHISPSNVCWLKWSKANRLDDIVIRTRRKGVERPHSQITIAPLSSWGILIRERERAYSYPLYGASAEKPPVAPASNQYVTYTPRARRYRLPAYLPPCLQEGNRSRRGRERERERESVCVCPCMCVETYFAPPVREVAACCYWRRPLRTDFKRSFRASSIRDDNRYHFRHARARRVKYAISRLPGMNKGKQFFGRTFRRNLHRAQINLTLFFLSAKLRNLTNYIAD